MFFFRGWGAVGLGAQGHFRYIVTLVTLFDQRGPDNSPCGSRRLVFQWYPFGFEEPYMSCSKKVNFSWIRLTWKITRGVTSCRRCSLDKLPCHDQFSANRNPIPYNVIFQFYMSSFRYTSPPPKKTGGHPKEMNSTERYTMTLDLPTITFTSVSKIHRIICQATLTR